MGKVNYIIPCLSLLFLGMSAADCGSGPGVKIWEFQAEDAAKPLYGLYRGDEKKSFGETDVKYCINSTDMEFLLNKLRQCKDIPPGVQIDNNSIIDVLLNK